jgi:hypothetical protein
MSVLHVSIKRLALLLFVVAPVAAWALVKPVRVIAPELVGISCNHTSVCVEETSTREVATKLYAEGTAFVSQSIAPLAGAPRVVFCSTEACASAFGLGARSAVTVGTFGTVIGPRAWKPYYVRHELIHHLQGQRMGVLPSMFKPTWFVEGMAYSLSQDPRLPLAEPWESHRAHFNAWYGTIAKDLLWQEAAKL